MAEVTRTSEIPFASEVVWAWLTRPGAAARLFPPSADLVCATTLPGVSRPLEPGSKVTLLHRGRSMSRPVVLRVAEASLGDGLILEHAEGSQPGLRIAHHLNGVGGGGSILETRVSGKLSAGMASRLLSRQHAAITHDLERHGAYAGQTPLRIAVSGSTGLVGRRLCSFLAAGGHTVMRLTRGLHPPSEDVIPWDPTKGVLDPARLEGLNAVIHLAGANLAEGRWNPSRKASIRDSRVEGTNMLVRSLAAMPRPPRVFLSASAIGYYGDTGDRVVDEASPQGEGFLAEVCREWEAASWPLEDAGVRVVHLRMGMVLAREGGALAAMLPPFRLGLGGPLGSGRQFQSWIALEDLLAVMLRGLHEDGWRGPHNVVAPEPLRQKDFARALGHVLRRPAFAPLPAFVVRAMFGEMGQALLLEGQRVRPEKLQAAGFTWATPDLAAALSGEFNTKKEE